MMDPPSPPSDTGVKVFVESLLVPHQLVSGLLRAEDASRLVRLNGSLNLSAGLVRSM